MGVYINGLYVFSPVTANDRAGLLYVASILSLIFTILTLAVRYHIQRRTFGADFYFILAATVVGLGQYIAVFVGLDKYGLGKASNLLAESDAIHAGRATIASICLFIISNALSKYSVIFFMKRLFSRDNQTARLLCNSLLVLVAIWTVASILGLTIGCGPSTKLVGQRCSRQLLRWSLVTVFDSLFEVAITVLSIILVIPLQMSKEIKISVVFAFSFRITVAIIACIHVYYISLYTESYDPGIASVYSLLWQQIELGYALMAATIPTLRSFIRGYEKAMGWEASYYAKGTSNAHSSAHHLSNLKRSHNDGDEFQRTGAYSPYPLRPDRPNYKAKVSGPDVHALDNAARRTKSSDSGESREPIIKSVEVEVMSEAAMSPRM